ncbi:MAG: STAS domain-containing protein [Actinomycetota bacterium]|nr:STAS domain-containing protein [Actinomycetota bacterium]
MLAVRIVNEQIPIVILEGKISENDKNEIEEAINIALQPNKNQLILDLMGVKSLDSGEAEAIVEATHRTLGRGGRVAFVVSKKDIENALKKARVFDIPGVLIFKDRAEAIKYLGERRQGIA